MMGTRQNGQNNAGCEKCRRTNTRGARQRICRLARRGKAAHAAAASNPKATAFGTLNKNKPDDGQSEQQMYDENDIFHGGCFNAAQSQSHAILRILH